MKPTQEQLNNPKWWDDNAPEGYDFCFYDETCNRYWFYNKTKVYPTQSKLLAKRPTKPAFVPEVGVECEYSVLKGVYSLGEVLKVTKPDSFNVYAIMDSKTNQLHWATDIRPIKSERELFVEQLAKLGKGYGSLYSEEFAGEVYDSGLFCLKETDK